MAVTAKFQADFSDFSTAVDKAQVQLKGFEGNAGKVETALNRMVNNFSGVKLIQQATLTAEAVDRIGGSSKLTATELQKVGTQAAEAAAKMKALGQDVPPKIQNLANQATAAGSAMSRLGEIAAGVFAGFGAVEAIQKVAFALVSIVTSSFSLADHLDNLSKATGISTDDLQELGFAGKRVGVDLDEISGVVGQLEKRIGTGDEGAVGAIAALGLNLRQLRQLSAADQFIEIADAVGKIQDPIAQAGIGSELFGRRFQTVLELSKDGLRQTMDQASQFGAVLDKNAIKTLDDFGDTVGDVAQKLKVLAAAALAPSIHDFAEFLGVAKDVSRQTFIDPKQQQQFEQFGGAIGRADLKGFSAGITLVGQAASDLAAGNGKVLDSATLVANTLKALRSQAMEPLTKAEQDQIVALEKYGKSTKDIAALTGVSEVRVKAFEQAEKDAAKAAAQAAADFQKLVGFLQQIEGTKADFKTSSLADALDRIAGSKFVPSIKDIADSSVRSATDVDDLRGSIEDLQRSGLFLEAAMVGVNKQFATLPNVVPQATAALADARKEADSFADTLGGELDSALKNIPKVLEHAFTGGGNLQGAVKAIGVDVGSAFGKSIADKFGPQITSSLGDTFGGAIKDILPGIGALLGAGLGALFKIGGPSQAEVAGRQIESQFEAGFGGLTGLLNAVGAAYAATGRSAAQAQADVKALLDAEKQGGAAAQAAIDKINGAFSDQAQDAADLQAAIEKYGFTIDQLGPTMKKQQLDTQATGLINDFRLLVGSGIDVDTVLGKMSDSVNAFIHDAIATGVEVPAALRPVLEKMAAAGELTDANGQAITDLSKAGVTFAETMSDAADRIVKGFNDILEKIGLIPAAARDAAAAVNEIQPPSFGSGGGDEAARAAMGGYIQAFAGGGHVLPFTPRGTDTVPAMLTPGELVLNKRQQQDVFGSGSDGEALQVTTNVVLEGHIVGTSVDRYLTRQLQTRRKLRAS